MSDYFIYGNTEIEYLKSKDAKLAEVIDRVGMIQRPIIPDLFKALIHSIVGQQISTKAVDTIWKRMLVLLGDITPKQILLIRDDTLQSVGLTFKKVEYIKNIASLLESNALELSNLQTLSDQAVCDELSKIKGIGVWTAEMIMMHTMQRSDILSFGDLAILRGMRMLYHHRKITPQLFKKYKRRYSPYGSVASMYLWAISAGAIPEMKDYAPKKR